MDPGLSPLWIFLAPRTLPLLCPWDVCKKCSYMEKNTEPKRGKCSKVTAFQLCDLLRIYQYFSGPKLAYPKTHLNLYSSISKHFMKNSGNICFSLVFDDECLSLSVVIVNVDLLLCSESILFHKRGRNMGENGNRCSLFYCEKAEK